MGLVIFFLLSLICLSAILGIFLSRNQAYSALFLVLALAALAGLYGLLDAPFIAVVQVIIYAGAIVILFIFVIMMIRLGPGVSVKKKTWTVVLAAVLGLVLGLEVLRALSRTPSSFLPVETSGFGSPSALGRLLMTNELYAFELTSVLLLAALVGAIVLTKKREKP